MEKKLEGRCEQIVFGIEEDIVDPFIANTLFIAGSIYGLIELIRSNPETTYSISYAMSVYLCPGWF